MLGIMCDECGSEMFVRGGFTLANGGISRACVCPSCKKREVVEFNNKEEIVGRRQTKRINNAAHQTMCWRCANAKATGCEWHRNFTPVEGWAVKAGHCVVSCPKFVPDKPRKVAGY